MEQTSPLQGGSLAGTTDVSPAADNPQLLKLLDESVQLMSTIVAGDHVQCQDTQAQLQSALENIKQQLQGQEMQMDRPKTDDSAERDYETDDVAGGMSDQQVSSSAGSAEEKSHIAMAVAAPLDQAWRAHEQQTTDAMPGSPAVTASNEAFLVTVVAEPPLPLSSAGMPADQQQPQAPAQQHVADVAAGGAPVLQAPVNAVPAIQHVVEQKLDNQTDLVAATAPCEQQQVGAGQQFDSTKAVGEFTAVSATFSGGLPPLPPRSMSSKSSSPTKGAAAGQAPRQSAVVANAQEQATMLASALSAVAAAAASQQLPVDTASDLAAALVRSASRACLAGDGETAAVSASAFASLADQAADDDISSFAQPSVQIEAVAAALLEEQQQRLAATPETEAQPAQQERPAVAAAVGSAAADPEVPSQQAFAEALQAIAAEQLASVASTSALEKPPAATLTAITPASSAAPPAEEQQQAGPDAPAAVLAALSNLPTGVPASSVKPGAVRRTVSASKSQSALTSTNEGNKPAVAESQPTSSLGQLLLAALQERLTVPAPPAAGGSAATTPTTTASGSASELLREAGLPVLQPIRTVSSISAESGTGSQPGTPNLGAGSTNCTGGNNCPAAAASAAAAAASAAAAAAAAASAAAARNQTTKQRSQNGRGSSGSDAPAPVAMSGDDLEMAKLLLTSAEQAVGQPGPVLTELLGFTGADEADVMAAIQDSGSKPVQAIASYLHNIRVVNMDAALAAAEGDSASTKQAAALKSLAETLLASLVDSYCNIIADGAAANALTSAADTTASQSAVQAVVQAQQQQMQHVAAPPPPPAVPAAALALAATPAAPPVGLEQIQAQLASLLAGTQVAPPPVAVPPAPHAATAANLAAALAAAPQQQQAALAGLLQQLSGVAPAVAAVPAAVAVPHMAVPAAAMPTVPVNTAAPDLATALSTALQVIAAQQQQHQQQQQNAALQLQAAVQQAAQQQLAQHQAAQQVAVAQQQLAQQQAAAAHQQLAQQQAAAAAAAVAAAGLTGPQPNLDLQSLQLLASLHQQHQQATVDTLGHIPSSAGLMLTPSSSLMAPTGGAAAANAAVAAAAAAAGLQRDMSRMNSAASGLGGQNLSSLLSGQLASSSVAMSLAANSAHVNLPAVSYNLPSTTLGAASSVVAPGAPSLQPAFPQQQQQHLSGFQGHMAVSGYTDSTATGHWAYGGHELAQAGSVSGVAGQKAANLNVLTALGLSDGAAAGHAAAVAAAAAAVTSSAAPSGPPSNEGSYGPSRASSLSVAQGPSAPVAVPAAARVMAAAAAQQPPMGTPPSAGQSTTPPSAFMEHVASYGTGGAQDTSASQNAAALAHMANAQLEAAAAANAVAAAANQQQQQHAHQQAAAAVAAAVQAQAQQQAQQQATHHQLVGDVFYGYPGNAAAAVAVAAAAGGAGAMPGMMGLPPNQLNYTGEGVDWQLLQQQMQQAQAQQAQQQQQQ